MQTKWRILAGVVTILTLLTIPYYSIARYVFWGENSTSKRAITAFHSETFAMPVGKTFPARWPKLGSEPRLIEIKQN